MEGEIVSNACISSTRAGDSRIPEQAGTTRRGEQTRSSPRRISCRVPACKGNEDSPTSSIPQAPASHPRSACRSCPFTSPCVSPTGTESRKLRRQQNRSEPERNLVDLGRLELPTPWLQKRFNPICNPWPALVFCELAKCDEANLRGFCSQSCSQVSCRHLKWGFASTSDLTPMANK